VATGNLGRGTEQVARSRSTFKPQHLVNVVRARLHAVSGQVENDYTRDLLSLFTLPLPNLSK